MTAVRIHLVGHLRVLLGDRELDREQVGTRKARVLLARLAVDPGHALSVGVLAEAVWPAGLPRAPADNLATLVSRVRAVLGPEAILGDRTGWRLGDAVDVDVGRAAALVANAESVADGEPAVRAAAALAAVQLLDGELLVGEADAPWAESAREQAAALLRRARHLAADACRRSGDPERAVTLARAAVAADPLDEAAVRLLMRAHRDAGEPGRALAVYADLRRVLARELGADPAPQTRALHHELLVEAPGEDDPGERPARPGGQPPAGAGPPAWAWLTLTGRDPECQQLVQRWQQAAAGQPGLVLLVGPAGIGKTRLAEELARVAAGTGGTVLSARCYDAERSLFLQPLVDALRPVLLSSAPATLRELAGDRSAHLATLVPQIAGMLPAAQVPPDLRTPDAERRFAYEAVATVVHRLSSRAPVLVVLDDLHNAGLATVEQLHLLIRTAGRDRVLVVGTVRTDEGAEALRRLQPLGEVMTVGPLPAAAVAQLAAAAGHGDHGVTLASRTRGHPLFVVESLQAMRAGEPGAPASLTAAVAARVARLDGAVVELLRAACILGSSFEPAAVAQLLAVPVPAAVRGCEQLVEAGLISQAGRAYEFANDLVQEILYASTPEPTRYAYHALAVDLFEGRPEARAVHATACGRPATAAAAWLEAAGSASARFAAADAERLLTEAAAAARAADDPALTARALLSRGRERESLGRYADAVADLERALELCTEHGLSELEMAVHRELAGDASIALGRPVGSCIPHLHAGLELARRLGDDGLAADLLGRLAVLSSNRLDFVTAREHGLAAVHAGRASGDPAALRHGLDGLKTSAAYIGDFATFAEVVAELEPAARRAGDLFLLQWLVFERSFLPLSSGDWAAAVGLVEEATALNRRSGRLTYEGWFLAHLGWIARLAGNASDAVGHGRRAAAAAPPHGHTWFGATASSLLACTLLGTGRDEDRREAVQLLREGLAGADRSGAESYRLRCLAPLGQATGSVHLLAQAERMLAAARIPDGYAWFHGVDAYLALGRGWLDAGQPQRAAAALERLVLPGRRQGWGPLLAACGAEALWAATGHPGPSTAATGTAGGGPATSPLPTGAGRGRTADRTRAADPDPAVQDL